ncbi:MAG: hypothetical protein HKN87_06345 [Saprospiraceae bacterium]|nr:hypothetical protein [Saprospiraceae bacterium]
MRRAQLLWVALLCALVISCRQTEINVYSHVDNDLYQLLLSSGYGVQRFNTIEEALERTLDGGILMILSKGYPEQKTVLPGGFYESAREKNLKVYVEFPDRSPSGYTGSITTTEKERLVVTSEFFGQELDTMDILDAGLYKYVKVADRPSHLKGSKVAGFLKAVYGLNDTPNFPILFEEDNILVSTTKLSSFNLGRYSPHHAWRNVIGGILIHLSIKMGGEAIDWKPSVSPSYKLSAALSQEDYRTAVDRGAAWYDKARFLIHPDWKAHWKAIDTKKLPVGPPMDLSLPSGDGSLGVMEGHYSYINPDGSQQYRYWLRADCVAETAMTLATANEVRGNAEYLETAVNLMDFLYHSKTFKTPSSEDVTQSSYGLIGWADTHKDRYYGDDNARVILGSVLAAQTMENHTWNKQILELILANFRTSGKNGFRRNALMGADIDKTTWQILMERDLKNIAPHYESWLWATYLWLYDKTGYKPLFDKAKKAIEITMANYPKNWLWANGLQQERARMILPLAWLVRAEDNEQHRAWLNLICDDLLKHQVDCGALREELGIGDNGKYGAPKSNADYGTNEAPLIHVNGDPVADMLYTTNFAFFALNEAAQATQEPKYLTAVAKLADFLVKIQSTSSERADLDGCWFRAFNYENWEYYGSNADHGWGAWGTLTGWTQSFITTTLALKLEHTSYWEKTKRSSVGDSIEDVWQVMLPGVQH